MNYSRQRELIHRIVLENPIHPTADEVYALARAQETTISLGTVYRNLNLLAQTGVIKKIGLSGTPDRFDGRIDAHSHLLCEKCGRIYDVNLLSLGALEEELRSLPDITVNGILLTLTGICQMCAEKS
ncbi:MULTISPECIES: Fur family transcriptional regulator [Anaerotruncus]|jgi:Fe2+ or Zn2+ uptake regulation protein|uniref:Transcriptional repressor n=1 Tax=Anaerotruncus colihominis TaxID=169435 RepID=A0A845SZS8_9FIRM|nr:MULTISPECIES: transcriptional repressor [Anaerotruncus]MCI8492104.1 transcriptional repressor [Anaerotruncus sp.]MCR2024646.1 transcriptional repressor [Anaerotruncus colihominis]NBI78163.1 transcriptional repressor [Anaerotruncus colihominis]NDO40003.1 transcriptional repressor [Anaerotruncus colihominis]